LSKSLILAPESQEFADSRAYDKANLTIEKMCDDVTVFMSLQCPRRIELTASNGETYHYLCKEDDDLRKDMRMMEFASFVNLLLANDRRCRERNLNLVTYAVICLNEKCGMIEWVENTKSFRVVVESIYAEKKIAVDHAEIRRLLPDDLHSETPERRVANFHELLQRYPPVMHLWFLKQFTDLARWFQARLIFTRSVGVWSIVGFVVGLGDRHAENILMKEDSGSCVHVDFNCMFDRAKGLPIPENIPFRLTQNIVDGMGVLSTDATLAKTCELVMETLSAKKQKLVSVLRPFLYDPLLEWKKQNRASTEITAKMTLKEVERRLDGFSEDRSTVNSPECTVKRLIQQATDTRNLAMLFRGWQPYL
jgi:serine/threonine-protein kinase ATR